MSCWLRTISLSHNRLGYSMIFTSVAVAWVLDSLLLGDWVPVRFGVGVAWSVALGTIDNRRK